MVTQKDYRTGIYFNEAWTNMYKQFFATSTKIGQMVECLDFSFAFMPDRDNCVTNVRTLLDTKKLAAMYTWYMKGDRSDRSILNFFDEYKSCIDEKCGNAMFNSNYGYYVLEEGQLDRCAYYLERNKLSRHATVCINNNTAMQTYSLDKLCTNTFQFFIRDNELLMRIHMRSSNIMSMLPYDVFMACVFYQKLYIRLVKKYKDLTVGECILRADSAHYYLSNLDQLSKACFVAKCFTDPFKGCDTSTYLMERPFWDDNFELELNKRLLKCLL